MARVNSNPYRAHGWVGVQGPPQPNSTFPRNDPSSPDAQGSRTVRSHDCACAGQRRRSERWRRGDAPAERTYVRRRDEDGRNARNLFRGAAVCWGQKCGVGSELYRFPSRGQGAVTSFCSFPFSRGLWQRLRLARPHQAAGGPVCWAFTQISPTTFSSRPPYHLVPARKEHILVVEAGRVRIRNISNKPE